MVDSPFSGCFSGFDHIVTTPLPCPDGKGGADRRPVRTGPGRLAAPLLAVRSAGLANAPSAALRIADDGRIYWHKAVAGTLKKGPAPLGPAISPGHIVLEGGRMHARMTDCMKEHVAARTEALLAPLIALQNAVNAPDFPEGATRRIALGLVGDFGAIPRKPFAADIKKMSQNERAVLRRLGVRFGEHTLYMPALLKPASSRLLALLRALWTGYSPDALPVPKAGSVSMKKDGNIPDAFYYAAGYRPSGIRAVRIDMVERLAGLVRVARNDCDMREGFSVTPQMMSLAGCSGEDFGGILESLGFCRNVVRRVPGRDTDAGRNRTDPVRSPGGALPEGRESTVSEGAPETPSVCVQGSSSGAIVSAQKQVSAEEVEVVLWRLAPGKRSVRPGRRNPSHKEGIAKGTGFKSSGKGASSVSPGRRRSHGKKPDPDSPFAVLATLKLEGGKSSAAPQARDDRTSRRK